MFKARYGHIKKEQPDYWRTVYADSVNEAAKLAERFCRKGFRMVSCTSVMFS